MASKNSRPPDDDLTRKLREEARKRPPVSLLGWLIVLLFCGGPLVLIGWLIIPRPAPPPVAVIAFDECVADGAAITLQAQLVVDDKDKKPLLNHSGLELIFEEGKLLAPGKKPRHVTAETDDHGSAHARWPFAFDDKDGAFDFAVSYAGNGKRRSVGDRARVHHWPADASLLIVAAETLLDAPEKGWRAGNPLDMKEAADSGTVLKKLAADKRRIVYLAAAASDPWTYRRIRGWLEKKFRATFPPGPVLGRPSYGDKATAQKAQVARINALKKQFSGELFTITADATLAAELPGQRILLNEKNAPAGVVSCAAWKDLPDLLKQQ